jgi:5,6-dimethylbenzimidazole synthase
MKPVAKLGPTSNHAFPEAEKQGVYDAIYLRRDVRSQFLPNPIPDELLHKLLDAAHHAGSVGFMQPWSFIVIRSEEVKRSVKNLFERANEKAKDVFDGQRHALYSRLKLEGILESPVNLCVTCDPARHGPHVLGRHTIRQTDVYSTCCAIQNLWLAARAEGVGMGWVSILDPKELQTILLIPEHVILVAYLCLGYVSEFLPQPELEAIGWLQRLPLRELIFYEQWGKKDNR